MKDTTPEESETVEGGGGHSSSSSRKDRHSKVYTSKGPRDRRVRLAAHTAIQFYDVQDRLGYDRPSKAVDWLIDKAQSAIHNLNSNPSTNSSNSSFPQPDFHSFFPATNFPDASFDLGGGFDGPNWGNNDMDTRVGFLMPPFSQGEALQSNLPLQQNDDQWSHQIRPTLPNYADAHPNAKSSDFQNPFELGFRLPTRLYGGGGGDQQDPISHRGLINKNYHHP